MISFLALMTKYTLVISMLFTNIFSVTTGNHAEKIKDYMAGCKLSFAAVSDVHFRDNAIWEYLLDLGLDDMAKAQDRLDALVFDGDNTNLGSDAEYARFAKTVGGFDVTDNLFITQGNHDGWCGSWDGDVRSPEESIGRFCEYTGKICGTKTDTMYYSKVINGYYFIVLGSEGNSTSANLSGAQLTWFASEMENASATGLPIFVFLHQPINGTHGLPYNWDMKEADFDKGGVGSESDAVLGIISKYKNVFYISGHIHAGFANEDTGACYVSVEKHEGYTLINLPSYANPDLIHGGCKKMGTGYVIEAYNNKIVLRARNFMTGTWLTEYNEVIELN